MTTQNPGLKQGAVLMVIAALAFIGYAVVFFIRNFTSTGFELVHCPINSGPTLGDISWVAWENRKGIGKREGDGPNPKQRSD